MLVLKVDSSQGDWDKMEEEPGVFEGLFDTGLKLSFLEICSSALQGIVGVCAEEKRDLCVFLNCTITEAAGKCNLKVNCAMGWVGQDFYR